MKLSVAKSSFLRALQLAQAVVDRKATLPVLTHLLLRTTGERLLVAATDLNLTVASEVECEIEEAGSLAVGVRLHEIVKALPGDRLTLSSAGNQAEVQVGKTAYRVVGLPDREFPRLPDFSEIALQPVDATSLRTLIGGAAFAASQDESRANLNGAFLECDGATARVFATDGYRLAKCEGKWLGPSLQALIPRRGLVEIKRLLEGAKQIEIGVHSGALLLRSGSSILSVRLAEGQPSYEQVIPRSLQREVCIDRGDLYDALRRISLIASEKTSGVRFLLSPGLLRLESDNPDQGQGREELTVAYDGDDFILGFSAKYLMEALAELDTDEVVIALNGELDPCVLRPYGHTRQIHVIMPMRL